MGFNSDDANALRKARERFFPTSAVGVQDDQHGVMRVEVGNIVSIESPAQTLAEALLAVERSLNHGASTTVWIDVVSDNLPPFVYEAIEQCHHCGLGLVVTHRGASTHGPGPLLPEKLRRAVAAACRYGSVWHPIAQRAVDAHPMDD